MVVGEKLTFGEVLCADLQRKHIKKILADRSDKPHAAKHLLGMIRKLTAVALDQEWIENDPTFRVKCNPPVKGFKAWSADLRTKFEKHWEIGTIPRLVYSVALYLGHRRSDTATIKWSDIDGDGVNVVQIKTGAKLWLPVHPALKEVLEATPRAGEFVILNAYGQPYSIKALGMRFTA